MDSQDGFEAQAQRPLSVPPPPRSDGSQDSETSSTDFVKIDDSELRGVPEELLTNYGNRVANAVLGSALADNWKMDERDLYVPEAAGEAEAHPAGKLLVDLDEFDPLVNQSSHNLEPVLEEFIQKPQELKITELDDQKPKDSSVSSEDHLEQPHHDLNPGGGQEDKDTSLSPVVPKKDDKKIVNPSPPSPEPVDNVKEEVPLRRTSLLTHGQDESSVVASQIEDAIQEAHDEVGDLLDDFRSGNRQQNEHNSPAGDSGNDILTELNGERVEERENTNMRELSPDLPTYDRNGPLTFPHAREELEAESEPIPNKQPRPPTPPKDLSGPEEDNPQVIDLGPPPHSHGLFHRQSSHGLPSILKHTGEAWVDFKSVDPRVLEVLKWRDPKKSAAALALALFALILIAKFSVISLIAWTSLTILAGTLGFRVYKLVESHLKKTDGSNPFKEYLEPEIAVPQEKAHAQADVIVHHGQELLNSLRRLFLVENVCDSIKFAVLLWTLTYIGAWFSGICLATIFVLSLFTLPKVYELYQEPIDEYIALAKANVEKVNAVLQEKLPFLKPVPKDEKKEE